jgi:G:T-mismatch repair DNA endonuclease (very short patch repair protein)
MPLAKKIQNAREQLLHGLVSRGLTRDALEELFEKQFFSYSMVIDMLKRDHSDLIATSELRDCELITLLKRQGFRTHKEQYLALPQHIRLQFKYPKEMSLDEIKQIQIERSRKGQKGLVKLRKQWTSYTPKNTPEFWIDKGLDEKSAENAAFEFRRSKSPFSIHFVGYSSFDEAIEKISAIQARRGNTGLKAQSKFQMSRLEKMVAEQLVALNVCFEAQKFIGLTRQQRQLYDQRSFSYDFYVPAQKLLIECNGTYWHADPRTHLPGTVTKRPGNVEVPVEEIWTRDQAKLCVASQLGLRVLTFWELDMTPDYVAQKLKETLNV